MKWNDCVCMDPKVWSNVTYCEVVYLSSSSVVQALGVMVFPDSLPFLTSTDTFYHMTVNWYQQNP